MMHFMHNFTWL